MPEVHAKLSASASKRWLNCPGSVKLSELYPDKTSIYAEEGTLAHSVAEEWINTGEVSSKTKKKIKKWYADNAGLGDGSDMISTLEPYVGYVLETYNEEAAKDDSAVLLTEQRVEFDAYVPGGFGTSDVVIISDGRLHIIDLKYGKGVPVSAMDNSQLKLYAVGALDRFGLVFPIDTVVMTIYQPRLDNVSTDTISAEELTRWAENTVRPGAEEALTDKAHFCAGDWCRFCPARAECKTRASVIEEMEEYRKKVTLSPDEISEVLKRVDALVKFAEDIKASALNKLLEGEVLPGWKAVEGRSNRKLDAPEADIIKSVENAGYDRELFYEKKMITLTAMEKVMGKKAFGDTLGRYVTKPAGKPTLVPESDARPAISNQSAADDFADE